MRCISRISTCVIDPCTQAYRYYNCSAHGTHLRKQTSVTIERPVTCITRVVGTTAAGHEMGIGRRTNKCGISLAAPYKKDRNYFLALCQSVLSPNVPGKSSDCWRRVSASNYPQLLLPQTSIAKLVRVSSHM